MIIKKKFITLLELLIVIAILALTTGVVGFSINRALREQHFKTEVELVVDYLRLAQNLMIIMNADVHVIFETAENGSSNLIRLQVDNSVDDALLKLVTEKPKRLDHIHFIDFHRGKEMGTSERGKAELKFFSKGSVMSNVLIRLGTNEERTDLGALQRYICLPGYPKPIYSTMNAEDDPSCHEEKQLELNQRLIDITVQELKNFSPSTSPS